MSEFSFVEKPFLDQLAALDWTVIDQGPGIPSDPTKSLWKSRSWSSEVKRMCFTGTWICSSIEAMQGTGPEVYTRPTACKFAAPRFT